MHESPLTPWTNFYVIVGSASAALTGLMFVVVTLLTGARARRPGMGIAAFSTPTIVHFCVTLAVAAILSAPWQVLWHAGLLLGLCGLGGLAYSVVVVRRMRRQDDYLPVLEDWAWHVVFPLVSYVALVVAAPLLSSNPTATLFGVGAAMVLLLFIGIHNAWDNVTYIVLNVIQPPAEELGESEGASGDPEKAGAGDAPPSVSANHAGQPSFPSPAWPASQQAPMRKKS